MKEKMKRNLECYLEALKIKLVKGKREEDWFI